MKRALFLPDPEATGELAAQLATALPDNPVGWTILLQGELGAGKSTLARAMLQALGHSGAVPSPTYTLVEPYSLPGIIVYHIDLYRVSDSEELEYLGWSDLDDGLRLIEWPERVLEIGACADVRVTLRYEGAGRAVELTAMSKRGTEFICELTLPESSVLP